MLFTVTFTGADVSRLPDASRARTLIAYGPFETVKVFQEIEYGAVVSSAPSGAPSTRNWTPATASLSVAEADTVAAEPERVAPAAGAVTETTGFVHDRLAKLLDHHPGVVLVDVEFLGDLQPGEVQAHEV